MDLVEVTEGQTTVCVPAQDKDAHFPPGTAPVFYNPKMMINRDATVLLLNHLAPSDYLDAMGATGIRGIRVAQECCIPVTINDRDPASGDVIRNNVTRMNLPIEVVLSDVNALLSERSFDAVDLDPFGTPAPFIDAGVRGCRRFLFVTATDTAPLCGAHLKAGMRRYFALPMNTEYHSEVGLRILLGYVVRETVKYDRGVQPLFCFAREHFVRLHLRLTRGAKAADEALARIGYILQCEGCLYREEHPGMVPRTGCCPVCGKPLRPIGPVWRGSIRSEDVVEDMQQRVERAALGSANTLRKLLDTCQEELPTSTFYDYHEIAKRLRSSPPEIGTVLGRIMDAGYPATRTHYSGYGIKTEAPLEIIESAVRKQ